jgi:thiol-disulfide isomerase/thioredoxin
MTKYFLLSAVFALLEINAFTQTVLSGHFKSFPSTEFTIVHHQSAVNEFQGEQLATGKTSINGEFSAVFQIKTQEPVLLFIANQFLRLWLIPNASLSIDEIQTGEYVFSGSSANENKFLLGAGIMTPMAVLPNFMSDNFDPLNQIKCLDSIEQIRWTLYKTSFLNSAISKPFSEYCKGEIIHFSNLNKNQYAAQYIFGPKKIKQTDIPSSYYDFWNNFTLLDDSCSSDTYRNSLINYIGYLATKRLNLFNDYPNKTKYNETEFKILDSLLVDRPETKKRIKAEKIIFLIDYFDLPQFVETELKNYKREFPASEYNTFIQKKWDKKNEHAFTSPEFILKDISGKQIDIKSTRGNLVYIDFWGSWCKACIAQMPNSLSLQQKYKGKAVVFLYIDFYDTREKWIKAVKEKKITGLHLKAEKIDEQYFNDKFGLSQGFPRYALLDKNGVLVTSSAPHPNDKDLILLIDKYLIN